MTRAETLAEIKKHEAELNCRCDCARVPDCLNCTIAWLLQEIEYLNSQIALYEDALMTPRERTLRWLKSL